MTGETRRKERIGVVVSNKMQKTVVVAVETFKRHRIYKKILRQTRRFKVHDEKNACSLGDLVRIVETRPLSREKRWRVAEVLVRGEVAEVAPKEIGAELIEEISAKTPPPSIPGTAVEQAEAVEEPEARAEVAEAVEEPEARAEAAEAVEEPEALAGVAEAVEEPDTHAEEAEGEEERAQGVAEAEEPPEAAQQAPETEEER